MQGCMRKRKPLRAQHVVAHEVNPYEPNVPTPVRAQRLVVGGVPRLSLGNAVFVETIVCVGVCV